ncbi:MAG: O-antigen ligase family protein [Opitutae bacterium]|nr:O-antigen ligase family protein [Opitutae bacterium]
MIPQASSTGTTQARLYGWGEWLLVLGLAATLAWTTLCLGGYLAETMVVTSPAVFGLAALGGALWVLGRGGEPLVFNRAALLPLPFLAYALASVFWRAPAPWLAWREWLLWLQMWLVFVLGLHFGRSRRQTQVLVATFILLGLAGVALAAWQRYGNHDWMMLGRTQAEQFRGRSAGMFGIPNSLAGLLELMLPVCLAPVFSRAARPVVRAACGGLAALLGFAMVLTGSRGGWISLALALLLWPLLDGKNWRRRLAGAALVLTIAVAGFWALHRFSDFARERIQPFLDGRLESTRPIIWKAGLQLWRDHPWLGSGAASYNVLFDQYRPRGFLNEPDWAHNDYLNTLSDYGLAGFALWVAAGGALLRLGWRAVQRVRCAGAAPADGFGRWKWRLGLFLGLLAFALHLGVDFHTKLPALAFAAAAVAALLLRDEPGLGRPVPAAEARAGGMILAAACLLVVLRIAGPLYRAEALRYEARRTIDRQAAGGQGDLRQIMPAAFARLEQATKIDPRNGQAWSDLAYATAQSWHVSKGDLLTLGRRAEPLAERALALCSVNAEFWIRKGVALDMQARHGEGEACFKRALQLAPNSGRWWYYYAYHLSAYPGRKPEARQAALTCLTLDPANRGAEALLQELTARP